MKKFTPLLLCMAFVVRLQAAQLPVTLGSTVTFAALAGSTVTNTGPTIVNGNVGVWAGSAVTGFPPGSVVGGAIHAADGIAATAQGDLTAAYLDAAGRSVAPVTVAGDLGGQTLAAGLYKSTSSLGITGVLTLNGGGNANSVFIFQVASALTTATSSQVVLIGGANAANVFWQVGSSATLGTYSIFNGTIMAQASVSVLTGAVLNGRALARTGAVTLDSNSMVNPGAPITGPTPPALSGFTCPVGTALAGVPYNSFVVPTGGTSPYAFSISSGSLPPGSPAFSLNTSTGNLTGTPTGATLPYTFGVNVTDSAAGSVSASCTIAVTAPADQADVSITKSGPAPPTVATSTNIGYTIVVRNSGPSAAAGVAVTDILPVGTTFVSATSPCSSSVGTVTCVLGTMASGGSTTIALVVTSPSSSGSFDNTATVVSTTPDSNTTNNRSTYTLTASPLASVPALSTWGLALLALLLLLAGCLARFGRKADV